MSTQEVEVFPDGSRKIKEIEEALRFEQRRAA